MHASEIDGQWWTIPAERAKNGKTHRVYLIATALKLIGDTAGKGYIFPTPHRGKERSVGDTTLTVAVSRNLAIPLTDGKGKPLYDGQGKPATENRLGGDHFTPHDLRRTAATFMASMGFMDEIIDAVLNQMGGYEAFSLGSCAGSAGSYRPHGACCLQIWQIRHVLTIWQECTIELI
jgi:integrase